MKIFMLYDQIQAGVGTKDDTMIQLNITKNLIGPAIMMENYLKKVNAQVIATIYSGTKYYEDNKIEVKRKIIGIINKVKPDIIICGPCFNYENFSKMAVEIAIEINENTNSKAFCAMSEENDNIINNYKNKVIIVKTPKKGGIGLNDSLEAITLVAKALYENNNLDNLKETYCFN